MSWQSRNRGGKKKEKKITKEERMFKREEKRNYALDQGIYRNKGKRTIVNLTRKKRGRTLFFWGKSKKGSSKKGRCRESTGAKHQNWCLRKERKGGNFIKKSSSFQVGNTKKSRKKWAHGNGGKKKRTYSPG